MTRLVSLLGVLIVLFAPPVLLSGDKKPPEEKPKIPDVVLFFDRNEVNPKEQTMRFGLIVTTTRDPATPSRYKQLTYDPRGLTNNTCVKIDGEEFLFGHPPTKWLDAEIRLGKNKAGQQRLGMSSKGELEGPKKGTIEITQTAEIVHGTITDKADTCLVQYAITNKDKKPHKVGLRFLLDTFIGRNDGTPFLVPGQKLLVESMADYQGKDVPAFVQAIESPRLQEPDTVALINLQPSPELERAGRLTLGAWPDGRTQKPGAKDGLTMWDVPVFSMRTLDDAAAVLYWPVQDLKPGETRRVGFSYGLGHFDADDKGKLGLIVQGVPKVGEDLTIMAVVRDPKKGQTVTLKANKGLKQLTPDATQTVEPAPKEATQITTLTWRVRLTEADEVPVVLESSDGATVREVVNVDAKTK